MGQVASPLLANFDCQSPCAAALLPYGAGDCAFSMGILLHAASLDEVQGPSLSATAVKSQWPWVTLTAGEATRESGPGRWSKEKGQWEFREALSLRVCAQEEIVIAVSASTTYNLMISTATLEPRQVARRCFCAAEVLPRMRIEERRGEGQVYATPVIPLEVYAARGSAEQQAGAAGRVFLSFETKTGWAGYRREDESLPSLPTMLGSDACEAPGKGATKVGGQEEMSPA